MTDGALVASTACGQASGASIGELGSGRLSVTNADIGFYALSVGDAGTLECVNSQLTTFFSVNCGAINNNVMLFVNSTGSFSASLQNNATIVANGSTLTFGKPVNNSGWIIATNGSLQFLSSVTNSGSVFLGPDQFHCTSIVKTGSDVALSWQAFGGNHYRVQAGTNLVSGFSGISTDIVAVVTGPWRRISSMRER